MNIGLISDTHGLLRPQAVDALRGSDLILHAGDIGDATILQALAAIAPLLAVRGNNDTGDWAKALPDTRRVDADRRQLYLLHDVKTLDVDTAAIDAVISGHSHRPKVETRDGKLYINPGSAGPRRFKLPVTLARLQLGPQQMAVEILELV